MQERKEPKQELILLVEKQRCIMRLPRGNLAVIALFTLVSHIPPGQVNHFSVGF